MADTASHQLKEHAELADLFALLDLLEKNGIRAVVHGGWALDAVSGTSRPHSDIDMVANEDQRARLRDLFAGRLLAETSHKIEVEFQRTSVDFAFYRRTRRGLRTITPRIIAFWPPELDGEPRKATLAGREIPIIPLRSMYCQIANPTRKKAKMLEKNARDLQRLLPYITEEDQRTGKTFFPVENTFWTRLRLRLGL